LTLREAVKIFAQQHLKFRLKGSGVVIRQIPQPNTRIDENQVCLIECQPP